MIKYYISLVPAVVSNLKINCALSKKYFAILCVLVDICDFVPSFYKITTMDRRYYQESNGLNLQNQKKFKIKFKKNKWVVYTHSLTQCIYYNNRIRVTI